MSRPAFTPLVESLPATVPFIGPEAFERKLGRPFHARLGANESAFGPSPRVIAAMQAAAPDMWKYCDPENAELRGALAAHLGLAPDNFAIGEGIDALLGLVVRMFAAPGAAVVTSLGAYPTFNFHVAGLGARLVTVPYREDREDLGALLEAVRRENAPLVYLANPDNPMGSWWSATRIESFIAALPANTLLILDEAYCETAPADAIPAMRTWPNVLRMRTFSKAYGLAGLRCGYAIGQADLIAGFERVRNHFGVTRMTQIAAVAALDDQAWMRAVVDRIAAARRRIASLAEANGLTPLPSATNFVTVDCGRDGVFAKAVLDGLMESGVFVRKPMAAGLDRCIRISCAPEAELDVLAGKLPIVLNSLPQID
ncbi:MAG: pyridoxal phosphate-dependent aminotransferase [Rhizobiaceae bacterium]|nr:pyridoxal phosphate-dependent aminotransferase [Rhizobiaceae bacterium]